MQPDSGAASGGEEQEGVRGLVFVDRLDTLTSRMLAFALEARARHRQALEVFMTASSNITDALAREDAAIGALEQTATSVHSVIAELRATVEARIAADQATLAQLDALRGRVETVTVAEQTDVTPPATAG